MTLRNQFHYIVLSEKSRLQSSCISYYPLCKTVSIHLIYVQICREKCLKGYFPKCVVTVVIFGMWDFRGSLNVYKWAPYILYEHAVLGISSNYLPPWWQGLCLLHSLSTWNQAVWFRISTPITTVEWILLYFSEVQKIKNE